MPAIEYIVRPYQSPLSTAGVLIPSTPSKTKKATLIWGSKSEIPAPQMPTINVACCNEGLQEKNRESEAVRIYQNGDPGSPNYVDYARPKRMTHAKKDQQNCFGESLGWSSQVESSLDVIDAEWQSLFEPFDTTDQHCKVQWTFQYTQSGLPAGIGG